MKGYGTHCVCVCVCISKMSGKLKNIFSSNELAYYQIFNEEYTISFPKTFQDYCFQTLTFDL